MRSIKRFAGGCVYISLMIAAGLATAKATLADPNAPGGLDGPRAHIEVVTPAGSDRGAGR